MIHTPILFKASYRGAPVCVTHASEAEIESLAGPVDLTVLLEDQLEAWSLIAIRCSSAVEIHALGWRLMLANTWITSAVQVVNFTEGAIRTRSGKIYVLGVGDEPELDPELRRHLAYALTTWGFDDVSPG